MVVKKSSQQTREYDYAAYVSLVIIVLALIYFSFGAKITGHATSSDTAQINVTLLSTTAINFTVDSLNFGAGAVTTGSPSATINTDGSVTGGSWTPINSNLTLENIGNTNVSLALSAGMTAAQYIGGTNPSYKFKFNNAEAGSCVNASPTGVWTDTATGAGVNLCTNFQSDAAKDTINIGVQLTIPSDSLSGVRSDTFTATATSI